MNVGVIGSGYVGLVVGACLAESGNNVVCADIDANKIARLSAGEVPIYEPGLEPLIQRNLATGRLSFTTDVAETVRSAHIIFIAVGTPPGEDGSADLQHVLDVARDIGRSMKDEKVVITKSTVPVGTARLVREAIEGETDVPVHVCSNPEFLKEGAAVDDFMRPDRVVIAGESWDGESGAAPLDLRTQARDVQPMLRALEEAGIDAALLVAPDIVSVKAGHKLGARGLELFTGATVDLPREERVAALDQLGDAGRLASKLRLRVSLAGSLDDQTLPEVLARVPSAECVAVGRAFSSRALLVGVERAVRDLRALLG